MENSLDPPLLLDTILQHLANISRQTHHTLHSMIDLTQSITHTSMDTDFPPLPSQPNPDATNLTPDNTKPKRKKSRAAIVQQLSPSPNLSDA